jgi:hypothetical protein
LEADCNLYKRRMQASLQQWTKIMWSDGEYLGGGGNKVPGSFKYLIYKLHLHTCSGIWGKS